MPPKKKGGKKGPKAPSTLPKFEYEAPDIETLDEEYVTIHFKVVDLVGLVHEWNSCPVSTTVHALKQYVRAKHQGGLSDVSLYKETVHPNTLISAKEAMTLRELGISGSLVPIPPLPADYKPQKGHKPQLEPKVVLLYDFNGLQPDDVLISDPPFCLVPRHLSAADARTALRVKSHTHVGLAKAEARVAAGQREQDPPDGSMSASPTRTSARRRSTVSGPNASRTSVVASSTAAEAIVEDAPGGG